LEVWVEENVSLSPKEKRTGSPDRYWFQRELFWLKKGNPERERNPGGKEIRYRTESIFAVPTLRYVGGNMRDRIIQQFFHDVDGEVRGKWKKQVGGKGSMGAK